MGKTQPNLFAFPSVDALSSALRSYVIQSQAAGIARHGTFKVAVSGGSLPKTLAQALLAPSSGPNDVVDFARWETFSPMSALSLSITTTLITPSSRRSFWTRSPTTRSLPSMPSIQNTSTTYRSLPISTSKPLLRASPAAIRSVSPSSTSFCLVAVPTVTLALFSPATLCFARQTPGLLPSTTPRSLPPSALL
ncbi:hypothetical protein NM208_g13251 [Fusarium decemcellulare]|uniref:Uncharacterized protein n=1 Tax=Fusarium decemcellulare TaxID=57161 RepID=A0ACC1RKK0_9HYPO|nr:hypothetical protein NM208_g13251 [Fusarium decemcellulare]